ncbi:MAG: hypothetical protein JO257_13415 [Deltaproteobacteria bacterium]|nr:hypothetical protein [Deltaproteobacteria bacterium]
MRRVALVVVASAATAHASPWTVTAEGGGEVDTNVQRVETGPGLTTAPVSSGVLRIGGKVAHTGSLLGGGYAFGLSNLTRLVTDNSVNVENVAMFAGDARWLHSVGDRPASAGLGVTAIDAVGVSDPVGARTFRTVGGDALLQLRDGEDHRLTLGGGARLFQYKPDPQYNYTAPAANARLDSLLWHSEDRTRSLELATSLGFEARAYDGTAFADGCAPGSKPDPMCFVATDITRRDRYARAGVDLTYAGHNVLAIGYQLTLIDSNSFGQSLARHRVIASGTTSAGHVYATLLAILQIDQYLDGLILERDLQHTEFTNIEDENRSSLQLRVARKLSAEWSLEARAAVWRNIGVNAMELSFQRELVSFGLVYSN